MQAAARLGARYVVIECRHHGTHFDERFWAPQNAGSIPAVRFFADTLEILTRLRMCPLMYYNCVHGQVKLFNDGQYGSKGLFDFRHVPADNWAQKDLFEKNYEVDMNWFTSGKSMSKYSMNTDPTMDVKNTQWRRWITDRIRFMLQNYPKLTGTYIDTWPAGLPFFGQCAAEHVHDFGKHEWWNAVDAFMWEIRQATKACGDKIFMINDSRMPKKLLEAADLILNEDAGPISNLEKVFWHCLRAAAVGHNGKPSYQFHHWKPGITNSLRTKAFLACASPLRLGYCIFHMPRVGPEGDTVEDYRAAIEETAWALEERSDNAELSISSETCNIVLLKYTTANHDVELDFPGREVKVGSNV